MLSIMEDIQRKGLAAAIAYLGRVGFVDVESLEPDEGVTAVDGGQRVLVLVSVGQGVGEVARPSANILPDGYDRLDAIDIMVIAPGRALLRHHRGEVGR